MCKCPPFRSIHMAGTWVCSILVMFDLWIYQIAGCKKENSLITTCVQSQALNEPDWCAFFGCGASRCLRATRGTLRHWGSLLMGWLPKWVLLLCCCGMWEHEDPLTRTASSCLVAPAVNINTPPRPPPLPATLG